MDRIECSVWNNGGSGWGLDVLGGAELRRANFDRQRGFVILVLDGVEVKVNIAKPSFWNEKCGELIKKELGEYFKRHGLSTGDRLWLRSVEPRKRFAVEQ